MEKLEIIDAIAKNNTRAKARLQSSVTDMKEHQNSECAAHVHVVHNAEAILGGFETVLDNQLLQAQFQANGCREKDGWAMDLGPIKLKGRTLADGLLVTVMLILIAVHYRGIEKVTKKVDLVEKVIEEVAN